MNADVQVQFPSGAVKRVNMLRLLVQTQNAEFKAEHGMFLPGVGKQHPTVRALRDEYELPANVETWAHDTMAARLPQRPGRRHPRRALPHREDHPMNLPNVDLTAAAAELGLDHAPPFMWDEDPELRNNAEFRPTFGSIHAHPTVFTRWTHTGLPEVVRIHNPRNGLRFVAAHELTHYYQEQRDPDLFYDWGDYARERERSLRAMRPGMTIVEKARLHRINKYEAEADAIARRIWRKVQLT